MKRLFLLAVLAAMALPASADVVRVVWLNPTQNTNGTPLAASSITQTRVQYALALAGPVCAWAGNSVQQVISQGNGTGVSTPDLPPGNWAFRAFTTAAGEESTASNVACKVIDPPKPNPPTGLTVTVTVNISP
jgi:hypothetical protein